MKIAIGVPSFGARAKKPGRSAAEKENTFNYIALQDAVGARNMMVINECPGKRVRQVFLSAAISHRRPAPKVNASRLSGPARPEHAEGVNTARSDATCPVFAVHDRGIAGNRSVRKHSLHEEMAVPVR
jgi:hypothetical protein